MTFANVLYTLILYPIIQIIEISFLVFDKLFDNTGISVLGVSFAVTLLCLPLYIVAESWQETERNIQARLSGGISRIKTAFKGDEQYMILSTFYRENHYHPIMALRSSFGLFIQVPFFMAAYSCLSHMPALHGKSFLFIKDMGMPDSIFSIGSFSVNILPIAMTLINCISGTIYSKGHSIREKAQIYIMAAIFLVILYDSPAGLVLYWTMNNIFSLVKNVFYKLKHPVKSFYLCMCTGIVMLVIYLLFIKHGNAPVKKLIFSLCLLSVIPVPFYLKGIEYLLKGPLAPLMQNKKLRFSLFATASLTLCILTGVIIPAGLISSSVQEFSNLGSFKCPSEFLPWSLCQAAGFFIFWSFCIFFLFKEKIQTLLAVFFSGALVCAILNTYAFHGNYGSMDVTLKIIDGITSQSIWFKLLNCAVIIFVFTASIIAVKYGKSRLLSNIMLICVLVFVMLSFISISKIKKEYTEFSRIENTPQENSSSTKFCLSKNKQNVIVIMMDKLPGCDFEEIVSREQNIRDGLRGFKFYKNTASFNGHTLMASPALYGGYEYTPAAMNERSSESLKDKHNEALLLMPRIFTEQADFNAYISDTSWGNYSYIADMSFADGYDKIKAYTLFGRYTADWKKEFFTEDGQTLEDGLKRNLLYFGFFRSAPAAIREVIYYHGTYLSRQSLTGIDNFIDCYSALYYMPEITSLDSERSSFCMITNEATHFSDDMEFLNLVDTSKIAHPDDKTYIKQVASLNVLTDFFNWMKSNGVFDNTKIIIVSDHGSMSVFDKNFEDPKDVRGYPKSSLNPVLLVKDFNSNNQFETDSDTFMTNADVPAIAFENIVDNPVNPFTGKTVTSSEKQNGIIVTSAGIFMPFHSKSKNTFTAPDDTWFKVKDNIFNADNWTEK